MIICHSSTITNNLYANHVESIGVFKFKMLLFSDNGVIIKSTDMTKLNENGYQNLSYRIAQAVYYLEYYRYDKKWLGDIEKSTKDMSQANLFKDRLKSLQDYLHENNIDDELESILLTFISDNNQDHQKLGEMIIQKVKNFDRNNKLKHLFEDNIYEDNRQTS